MTKKNIKKQLIATYIIIAINYTVYLIDSFLPLEIFYLNHDDWFVHQFLTAAFCHANFAHLSGNMFFIYFFGRLVEEELGHAKFTIVYLSTIIVVNILNQWLMTYNGFSLGASGAVFGLFSISILMRLKVKTDWRGWIEIVVLAPFVISYVLAEVSLVGVNDNIGHFAHISGAVVGAVLYYIQKLF